MDWILTISSLDVPGISFLRLVWRQSIFHYPWGPYTVHSHSHFALLNLKPIGNPLAQLSFSKVGQLFGKADGELVWVPEAVLDKGPVGHASVSRHRVEVEIAVQVVTHPFHLVEWFWIGRILDITQQQYFVITCHTTSVCFPLVAELM